MALILACTRKLCSLDRAVREGKWNRGARQEIEKILSPIFPIRGQTLGIIGFGNNGRRIVPKAKGFEMRVIAFDPYIPSHVFKGLGVESVTLDNLLSESDFVSINTTLTEETRHLLGIEEFRKMKPTAYLINIAPGDIVDEAALCTALTNGYIAGAGLDSVARREKVEGVGLDYPLLKLKNIIFTAHSAWYSEDITLKAKQRAYEHLGQVFRGERGKWPTWFVNPEVRWKFLERWGKA